MTTPSNQPKREDALQPYTDALRERVPSREALLAEAKAMTRQRKQRNAAAGGLLTLAIAAAIWSFDPSWHSETVQVALGQRQQLTLKDGSQVVLNSGSQLRIEHRLRSRQLELLQGEALFTVVHDDQPFIVRSQGVKVRDIGTVFDIRSDRRGVQVAVLDGEVEVNNLHNTPRRLLAGEQLRATAEIVDKPQPFTPQAVTAWQHGKLRFDGTPLSEVVADLQHYRQAPIKVADARTGELRLSGEFDSASVEALINLLPNILPVTVQRSSDGSLTLYRTR